MDPYETNESLVDAVSQRSDDHEILARGPGGRPVVLARGGGEKEPAILLTAGAHATEQAGVVAAVELLDRLETDRQVYVVPTRDPLGVDGYAAALEHAVGDPLSFDDYDDLAAIVRREADLVIDDDGVLVGTIGDYAFGTAHPTDDETSLGRIKGAIREVMGTPAAEPLSGRRIFMVPGKPEVEGTGHFDRLYTFVVSPDGEQLHLNRFIGSEWAPPESRAVREAFDVTRPGLFVDLHEYGGDGCWVSVRPKADETAQEREVAIGRAMIDAVADADGDPLPISGLLGEEPDDDHYFTGIQDGLYDLDYVTRGEGFNATDYAAEHHGLAFTNETGMHLPFEDRVEFAVASVQRAVDEFERLHE